MVTVSKVRALSILEGVLRCPSAPFHEDRVVEHIETFCRARRSLKVESDRLGNRLVWYRRGRRRPTGPLLALAAHMDHPGFVAGPTGPRGVLTATFLGGVHRRYFPGARVRFFPPEEEIVGTILSVKEVRRSEKEVRIRPARPVPEGVVGMWNLPPYRLVGQRIHGRALDDLGGVGAILVFLDVLHRNHLPGEVLAIFTRGEEVGLTGATGLALRRLVPRRRCRLVTVETSKELVNARLGDGPIIRVGDRKLIFDAPMTYFLDEIAAGLKRKARGFQSQRRLMDGGMCESTTFTAHGYRSGALCVAMRHYHNMGPGKAVREEIIHKEDYYNLVRLFVGMVQRIDEIDQGYGKVRDRMVELLDAQRGRF